MILQVHHFATMFFTAILFTVVWKANYVQGVDLNSLPGRTVCYQNIQRNCDEKFIDVYKNLSRSATNLTDADTFFLLFTRKNPEAPEKLHECGGKLPPDTYFNPNNELIVILTPFVAGFCDVAVYREWKVEFLKRGDYNVLAVDYSWGNHIDFETAIENIKIVAKQTVIVLKNIQKDTGISKDKISLVGHSLGAQLAGMIGKDFCVKRITGLDPAGPGFAKHKTSRDDRLDPTDADFVDIWHCNAGECLPKLGIAYDAGHVNFYINGGRIQVSCYEQAFKALAKGDWIYGVGTAALPDLCFHTHCAQYYRASINPGGCQFVGVKCDNYAKFKSGGCHRCGRHGHNCMIMGFDGGKNITNIKKPQKYYLDTTLTCPYCDNTDICFQGFSETYRSSLQCSTK